LFSFLACGWTAPHWDAVVPVLEQAGHRTYPLTLPGMESLEADRSVITLRDHVHAVVAMIDSLDPTNRHVVLVGHSRGGAIAHAAVDARPGRVERVEYVDRSRWAKVRTVD
jgi:pimeloyl-ACP methyl ester carboxylesterase